jgi:hypothetical protein
LPRTNTLAYYKNPSITVVKGFIVQATSDPNTWVSTPIHTPKEVGTLVLGSPRELKGQDDSRKIIILDLIAIGCRITLSQSVMILSIILLSVVKLSVMAPTSLVDQLLGW